jgi:hypothetical protein
VRTNELDKDAAELIRDVHDQSVLVAAEIEDHAVVTDEIHGRTKLTFQVIRAAPTRLGRDGEPSTTRSLRLRVSLPELLECPPSDHLHKGKHFIMSPNW